MTSELFFSFSLVIYYATHSLLAEPRIKEWLQTRLIAARWYRLFYNLVAITTLLPIIYWFVLIPQQQLWTSFWLNQSVGGILLLSGIIILFLALRNYNLSEFSGTQQLKDTPFPNLLQTNGLNAYVRHPLYSAALLIFWGYFIYQPHLPALILAGVSTAYIVIGATLEERKLVEVFGESYKQYQRDTPMLIPSFL
ncbi:MAG: isoprenylcysteine carboxylmethyltransferase family protein [Saprospiraceae bacterium]